MCFGTLVSMRFVADDLAAELPGLPAAASRNRLIVWRLLADDQPIGAVLTTAIS